MFAAAHLSCPRGDDYAPHSRLRRFASDQRLTVGMGERIGQVSRSPELAVY